MLNKDVVLLRNERAWKRRTKVNGEPRVDPPPSDYPCWAYRRVVSYGYEEDAPEYLYRSDLSSMIGKVDEHTPAYRKV